MSPRIGLGPDYRHRMQQHPPPAPAHSPPPHTPPPEPPRCCPSHLALQVIPALAEAPVPYGVPFPPIFCPRPITPVLPAVQASSTCGS